MQEGAGGERKWRNMKVRKRRGSKKDSERKSRASNTSYGTYTARKPLCEKKLRSWTSLISQTAAEIRNYFYARLFS